ncbi:transcriptional co-activator ada2 [Cyclospora cayetanensis]|uniref:Transcriptional co-activator ada2 n=1 Tax=Cyclospora cayetanensis TaxID=88456 RepID=A0A1D3D891_9EIME|nr:transcriptional co-activator ada2 [Cyclospora cayetanensis]
MGVYLNSAASPLPDLSSLVHGPDGGALTPEEAKARREAEKLTKAEPAESSGGGASPSPLSRKSPKPSHSIVGYWPLRGDFDVEFDNDAELILADMEFKGERGTQQGGEGEANTTEGGNAPNRRRKGKALRNSPGEKHGIQGHAPERDGPCSLPGVFATLEGEAVQERQLKLQIIEIYNSKLDERIYRKNTIISRGLLDVKSMHLRDKKRTKEERDLHNLFKPLARFQSDEQQERLVQLLIEERRVRHRLALLHEWRSLGLKTAKEVEELAFCEEAQLPPVFFLLAKRMLVHEMSTHRKLAGDALNKPMELLVHRVGQLYDFHLNLWQFAACPQNLGAPSVEGPKEAGGQPVEGESQGVSAAAEQAASGLQLPQFVQPGLYRQLSLRKEIPQQAAAQSSTCSNSGGAREEAVGAETKGL